MHILPCQHCHVDSMQDLDRYYNTSKDGSDHRSKYEGMQLGTRSQASPGCPCTLMAPKLSALPMQTPYECH